MKKKLMVAAVAGALAAPAMALAQTSTVQIYGLLNVEYAPYVDSADNAAGASRYTTDQFNSGASRIGFRGQEKLGGNLTTWFQCETTVSFMNGATDDDSAFYVDNPLTNWCDRNSALGMRGGWGNFYVGHWDSPAKRVTSATRMLNETGWLGAQRLLMTFRGFNYSHRVAKSLNYNSPNMNGFSVAAQMTSENAARNQLETNAGIDGRVYGLNGIYRSGPLVVGLGWQNYENQVQFATPAAPVAVDGADDTVIVLGVNYTWGMLKAGFVMTRIEAERGLTPATQFERDSYNFALDWDLAGPGKVRFGATIAGETETAAPGATLGSATQYQVSYLHSFSKRTTGAVGFVLLDNGSGGTYNLQSLSTAVQPGDKSSALSLQLTHTF
jgi:predicted porin